MSSLQASVAAHAFEITNLVVVITLNGKSKHHMATLTCVLCSPNSCIKVKCRRRSVYLCIHFQACVCVRLCVKYGWTALCIHCALNGNAAGSIYIE